MTTPARSHPTPSAIPDPVGQAALAELLQLGLAVARVAARLADMEGQAVDVLARGATDKIRALMAAPASLADAIEAGRGADANDAARDGIAARLATITDSFDKAARAVRRTVALQARLAEGRPFRAWPGEESVARPRPRPGADRKPANDADRADRMDEPEQGDEIAGWADADIVRDIRRALGEAARLPGLPALAAGRADDGPAVMPGSAAEPPDSQARAATPSRSPPGRRSAVPEPDTG